MQNVVEYAKSLEIDVNEVMSYLALQELAHSRLYASVPWLMPRFEALLGKYARGTSIEFGRHGGVDPRCAVRRPGFHGRRGEHHQGGVP